MTRRPVSLFADSKPTRVNVARLRIKAVIGISCSNASHTSGAFKNRVNAEQAAENLRALKYRAVVTEGKRTRRAPGTES